MSRYPIKTLPADAFPDLHWFTGVWIGVQDETVIEEHWSRPGGDVFMGMFRMVRGDRPIFYEFMTLAVEGEAVVFRIKHFNPGLTGWEEKDESVEFVLVQREPAKAVFYQRHIPEPKWMVYQREGTNLTVHFETAEGEEPGSRLHFMRT